MDIQEECLMSIVVKIISAVVTYSVVLLLLWDIERRIINHGEK